jgi:hypothetical protein
MGSELPSTFQKPPSVPCGVLGLITGRLIVFELLPGAWPAARVEMRNNGASSLESLKVTPPYVREPGGQENFDEIQTNCQGESTDSSNILSW